MLGAHDATTDRRSAARKPTERDPAEWHSRTLTHRADPPSPPPGDQRVDPDEPTDARSADRPGV